MLALLAPILPLLCVESGSLATGTPLGMTMDVLVSLPPRFATALVVVLPDWAALGACFALAAAVVLLVFYIQPDASDLAPHRTKLDQLLERRDTIYDNLRDLKFEHRAGKYSEGDYELMKTSLENEAAVVLTEIEQVTESHVRRPRPVRLSDRSVR
ncbi:MAG: hypothetical protein WB607_17745 [Candidatus Acidiferrum sp.]|jgi:hypothetical protein